MAKTNSTHVDNDDYKGTAQAVTDEAMRIDNLAPNVLNAIKNDVPLKSGVQEIVIETIQEKDKAKEVIDKIIEQNKANKTNKLVNSVVSGVIGLIVGVAGTVIGALIINGLTSK